VIHVQGGYNGSFIGLEVLPLLLMDGNHRILEHFLGHGLFQTGDIIIQCRKNVLLGGLSLVDLELRKSRRSIKET
jgi:hypothetical protein